jgi:transposase-like protein
MPSKRIPLELKEQILRRIKDDGISAAQAAREHAVSAKTIYGWLGSNATIPKEILQMNKLRRENDELKILLAEAMLLQERSKKNLARHAC